MFSKDFEEEALKELAEMRSLGMYKQEKELTGAQGPIISLDGRSHINLCSNDYLGLANEQKVIEAAAEVMKQYGFGTASVRFIAGTTDLHKRLENAVSKFLGSEDTILYSSCFEANTGFFETFFTEGDAVISDELNHASIIDGIRLSKALRLRFVHGDLQSLEEKLKESENARRKVIVTDGVFSMDGDIAPLEAISKLARIFNALVMVDDSHGTGVLGSRGRGSVEGMLKRGLVDAVSSTFGKALGGAGGGFVSGKRTIIEVLRQRSRPYIFSNSLAPAIVGAALFVIENFDSLGKTRYEKVLENTAYLRKALANAGFTLGGSHRHPITPIMINDAVKAVSFAHELFKVGVYVRAFVYPVVPKGKARIRVQLSASHTKEMLDRAAQAFVKAGKAFALV